MSDRVEALIANGRVQNLVCGEAGGIDVTDLDPRPSMGWSFDGATFAPPPAFSRDEAVTKAEAKATVNAAAGASRSRYVTIVPGQEITYQLKGEELARYDAAIANGDAIDAADYPMLHAEAEATESTLSDLADLVRVTRNAWIQLASVIEAQRQGALRRITLATTEAEVLAAIPENWP